MTDEVVKIVTSDGGKQYLRSIFTVRHCVQYKECKWVSAPKEMADKGYHLLAFDGQEHARYFIETCLLHREYSTGLGLIKPAEAWVCEAEGIIPYEELPQILGSMWVPMPAGSHWPRGTVMARRLRLVERIRIKVFSSDSDETLIV